MATIYWGPWSADGRFRAGLEIIPNPDSIGAGTGSQLVTAYSWMQSRDSLSEYSFGNNWFLTGSIAAAGQTDYDLGSYGTARMGGANRTVTTSYTGTTTTTVTSRIHRNASPGAGGNASVTVNYVTPARPYTAPAPVTGAVSTRNSDGQATISWARHATTGAPYTSQSLQMRTYTGGSWSGWVALPSASASASSYVRTGLSANHVYQFQVRANNTVGSSAWADAGSVWMTPGAPVNVNSTISSSGLQILTTWEEAAYYTSPRVTYTIQRSVNGGAWTQVAAGLVPSTGLPGAWSDPAPGAGNNQYRVAAYTSVSGLTSAFVAADVVSTIVPPLAPSNLNPNGQAVDLTLNQLLTWKHNPGTDKAAQSLFFIQTSSDGGTTWVAAPTMPAGGVSSTVSSWLLPAGSLVNGTPYLWRVADKGVASAGYGPYSPVAVLTGSTTPVITLDPAHPANPTVDLPLDTGWVYQQDELSPQTAWQAQLLSADGLTILETQSGAGETFTRWAYPVIDGTTYLVRVRAQSGAGVWSNWAQATTTINLPSPGPTIVTPEYDPCTGVMILHIVAPPPVAPAVAVQYVTIERRAAGFDWVVLSDYFEPDGDFIDLIPLTNGLNEYRITSISSIPTYLVNTIVAGPGLDGRGGEQWVLVAYGDGFANILRFHGDPKVAETAGRASAAQPLLGREKPLAMFGQITAHELEVGGSLYFDAPCPPRSVCGFDSGPADWVHAAKIAEIVCYRDYTGRRLFGFMSGVGVTDEVLGTSSVAFHFTETEFADQYGSSMPPEGV